MTRVIWALLLLSACPASVHVGTDGGSLLDAGPLLHHFDLAHNHVASCDDPGCGEASNPPLGGPHCPMWSPCRVFDAGVSRCSWLHNLEHGHAVLAYNCPEGCPEIVSALTAIWQQAHDSGNTRVLVTPDSALPSRVAAVVWGWGWVGNTLDADAIHAVLSHQDEEAPEHGLACSR